jgi:hypothetical protein
MARIRINSVGPTGGIRHLPFRFARLLDVGQPHATHSLGRRAARSPSRRRGRRCGARGRLVQDSAQWRFRPSQMDQARRRQAGGAAVGLRLEPRQHLACDRDAWSAGRSVRVATRADRPAWLSSWRRPVRHAVGPPDAYSAGRTLAAHEASVTGCSDAVHPRARPAGRPRAAGRFDTRPDGRLGLGSGRVPSVHAPARASEQGVMRRSYPPNVRGPDCVLGTRPTATRAKTGLSAELLGAPRQPAAA